MKSGTSLPASKPSGNNGAMANMGGMCGYKHFMKICSMAEIKSSKKNKI